MNTNKRSFRRFSAFILSLILLVSLAGCGAAPAAVDSSAPETNSSPAPSGTVTSPTGSATEPVEAPSVPEIVLPTKPSPGTVKAASLIEGIEAEAIEGKAADEAFTGSQYRFAADLLRRSYAQDGGNCLVSPLSVVLALSMTANGAAGDTLQQMLDVIGNGLTMDDLNAYLYQYVKNLPSSEKAKLAVANSIWLNDREDFSVREEFLKKDASWYGADVYKLPFTASAVGEINGWVSKNTDGMIEEIVDSLDEAARMLLINAICFDAKWQTPYQNSDVQEAPFALAGGSEQTVSMMYGTEYEYYVGEGYTGFGKYYEGNGYKFVGILPDKNIGLDQFIAGLDGEKLSAILAGAERTRVSTGLPKFSYDYSLGLKPLLQDMGMNDAFVDDDTRPDFADFSPMSDTNKLYISDVIHKTFIEMTEAGTRAAAVTAVLVFETTAIQQPPKVVILDRPFLYMIVDAKTDLPIFIGTVNSVE